eukprot:248014-Chlamydomonas_euryale.AAC.2
MHRIRMRHVRTATSACVTFACTTLAHVTFACAAANGPPVPAARNSQPCQLIMRDSTGKFFEGAGY